MARIIEHDGKRLSVSGWARDRGMRIQKVYNRMKLGWTLDEALEFVPRRAKSPRPIIHGVDCSVITVRITDEQHALIKSAAHRRELSMNQFCVDAIIEAAQ
jgi:predicted HicB family RNase H-like nuclease